MARWCVGMGTLFKFLRVCWLALSIVSYKRSFFSLGWLGADGKTGSCQASLFQAGLSGSHMGRKWTGVKDKDGRKGYGDGSAFSSGAQDTAQTAFKVVFVCCCLYLFYSQLFGQTAGTVWAFPLLLVLVTAVWQWATITKRLH